MALIARLVCSASVCFSYKHVASSCLHCKCAAPQSPLALCILQPAAKPAADCAEWSWDTLDWACLCKQHRAVLQRLLPVHTCAMRLPVCVNISHMLRQCFGCHGTVRSVPGLGTTRNMSARQRWFGGQSFAGTACNHVHGCAPVMCVPGTPGGGHPVMHCAQHASHRVRSCACKRKRATCALRLSECPAHCRHQCAAARPTDARAPACTACTTQGENRLRRVVLLKLSPPHLLPCTYVSR